MIPTSEAARVILTHLLEIGVYALVIFGAVLAFRRVFHNKTRPALRFGLWLLLLLRLTVPFTVNSAIHLIVLPASQPTEAVAVRTEASAQPIRPATVTNPAAMPTGAPDAAKAPTEEAQAERAPAAGLGVSQWLVILWAVGAAAFLVRRVWMRGLLAARVRTSARAPDPETQREFRQLCQEMHIRRPVRLLEMEDITSPALTIGPRPTVLLPSFLTEKGRARERRFALLHELTHLKRGDDLILLWYGVLRCLWWFHPVVYLMEKPFRMDMESACDARAVRGMSRQEKLAYAALLLELSGEGSL